MTIYKALTGTLIGLILAGCGFRPLYNNPVDSKEPPFILEVKGDNDEAYGTYKFKQELKPLIAQLKSPFIRKIIVTLTEFFGDIGYESDASVLRSQGKLVALLQIYDKQFKLIYENRLDSSSSYTLDVSEEFSNLNARIAIRGRLIAILAQDVAQEIYLATQIKFVD